MLLSYCPNAPMTIIAYAPISPIAGTICATVISSSCHHKAPITPACIAAYESGQPCMAPTYPPHYMEITPCSSSGNTFTHTYIYLPPRVTYNRQNLIRSPKRIHTFRHHENPYTSEAPIHKPALQHGDLNDRGLQEHEAGKEHHGTFSHELDMCGQREARVRRCLHDLAPEEAGELEREAGAD